MEPVRYLVEVKEPRSDWSLLVSVIAVIAVINSFTCKRGNKVNSVLYWPFRLVCMHIIKDIWPKTDNYNNDYSNFPISISNQPSGNSSPPPPSFRVLGTKCLHDIQSRLFEHDNSLFFSYVFWLGDLNYRINEAIDNIKGLCGKKEYSTLWKHDQVDNLFHNHYLEGRATFPAIPVWNATW